MPRHGNKVQAFTCGRDYLADLANEMRKAKKFIFIFDWQLDYDVELDQRGVEGHPGRLSEILGEVMKRGVHVRVLLYDSVGTGAKAGTPDTHEEDSRSKFMQMQDAIHKSVKRDGGYEYALGTLEVLLENPSSGRDAAILFSHHQKGALIDGQIAYLGGMDIAYTRWDTPNFDVIIDRKIRIIHDAYNQMANPGRPLTDREIQLTQSHDGRPGFRRYVWNLEEYTEAIGLGQKLGPSTNTLDERFQPRQPWQDSQVRIEGPAVFDVFKNFVRRWNSFIDANTTNRKKNLLLEGANKLAHIWDKTSKAVSQYMDKPLTQEWFKSIGGYDLLVDPLIPGPGTIGVQILRTCSNNQVTLEKTLFKTKPNWIDTLDDWKSKNPVLREVLIKNARPNGRPHISILEAMVNCIRSAQACIYIENQFFTSHCGKSRHGVDSLSFNWVMKEIAQRVQAAIYGGKPFHVYLVLPVHPEGQLGSVSPEPTQYWILQTIKHGEESLYNLIKRAILYKRKGMRGRETDKPDDLDKVSDIEVQEYVTVLNMRNFGMSTYHKEPGEPAQRLKNDFSTGFLLTEQIYVHNKLMIVDDAAVIVGSANINDRSLQGDGDTELSALIVDETHQERDIGEGVKVITRDFARDLRIRLWKKHLGMQVEEKEYAQVKQGQLSPRKKEAHPPAGIDLEKPLAKSTIKAIQQLARENAKAYEEIFNFTPRNSQGRFIEANKMYPSYGRNDAVNGDPTSTINPRYVTRAEEAQEYLKKKVKGFWIEAPLDWGHDYVPMGLKKENMAEKEWDGVKKVLIR